VSGVLTFDEFVLINKEAIRLKFIGGRYGELVG